ncbi:MAG: M13 family metallopeptidase [Solobacterium sp.]|nr:M13 family metallopeptidase [Solobacterium sp.]
MWKKITAVVLAASLVSACGAQVSEGTVSDAAPEAAAQPETEAASGTRGQGGTPWTDYDLKENISADLTLSPKDDLYYAVNKDWLATAQLPEGRSSLDMFDQVKDNLDRRAIAVLEGTDNPDSRNVQLVRTLYSAFLDWQARDETGVTPLEETINRINAIKTTEELTAFIADPDASFGVPALLDFGTTESRNDASRYVTALGQTSLLLGEATEYQNRTELGDRMYESRLYLVKALLSRIGYTEAQAQDLLDQAIAFEAKLADVCYTSMDQYSPDFDTRINNVRTPEEIDALMTSYPLRTILAGHGYGDAKEYLAFNPGYLDRLNELYTEDNLDAVKTTLIVKTALNTAALLDSAAYQASIDANNILSGASGRQDDRVAAFDMVRGELSSPMGQAYLEAYDYSELKQQITDLCMEIKNTYRTVLEQEDWLSEETRAKAVEKLDHLRINALYPDKWTDCAGLDLEGLSYYECRKAVSQFNENVDAAKTNGKVDPELWNLDILEPNAYYNPADNSINMILGMIGDPLYEAGEPEEILMGTYGSIIGHEISHAFDTSGAQYDKDGNLSSWWTDEDYDAFQKRAQRMIDYYNAMTAWEGQPVSGDLIQTEAIADMGGMKVLLEMAKSRENFDYQAFFRAYAGSWARINTFEQEQYSLNYDSHPLAYLRANATVQQFEEFYTAFDVKEGDGMYLAPEARIAVW